MKKIILTTAAAIVLSATTALLVPSHASPLTGDALALACAGNVPDLKRDKNTEKYLDLCNSYINGWDDARFAFLQGTTTYCPPTITVKELSVVFFDYVDAHREAGKLPAAEALMLAFKDKWPCKQLSDDTSKQAKPKETQTNTYNYTCKVNGKKYPLRVNEISSPNDETYISGTLEWWGKKYNLTAQPDCAKYGWHATGNEISFDFCTATQGWADIGNSSDGNNVQECHLLGERK